MKAVLVFLTVIIFALGFFFMMKHAIELGELSECIRWEKQSRAYPGWYATGWQADQCRHYNIKLP